MKFTERENYHLTAMIIIKFLKNAKILTIIVLKKDADELANSEDPDQTDLGLHCFLQILRIFMVYKMLKRRRNK